MEIYIFDNELNIQQKVNSISTSIFVCGVDESNQSKMTTNYTFTHIYLILLLLK